MKNQTLQIQIDRAKSDVDSVFDSCAVYIEELEEKTSEVEIIKVMQTMCEYSLEPESLGLWEKIKRELCENRQSLKNSAVDPIIHVKLS